VRGETVAGGGAGVQERQHAAQHATQQEQHSTAAESAITEGDMENIAAGRGVRDLHNQVRASVLAAVCCCSSYARVAPHCRGTPVQFLCAFFVTVPPKKTNPPSHPF
jgi:hypothetical protein